MSTELGYGREEIVFATEEATYGTMVLPTADDAMKVLKSDFGPGQERKDRQEKGASRSIVDRITGRKSVSWSIDKYLLPSGTAGTAPDDMLLFEALFGDEAIVAETSVTYSLLAEPALSLGLFRNVGHFAEAIYGAVPSKFSLKWGGNDEPKVTFSGEAKDHLLCGSDVLTEDVTASDEIVVTDARQFAVGMVVSVGDNDNGGDGFTIDEIDYDTNTLTLSAAVADEDTGAAVVPLAITPTTSGNVIPVVLGTITLGGGSVYITGGSFDIDQKVKLRNDEFGYSSARGYRHPDFREVTCSLDLYFEKAAAKWLNDAKRFTAQAISVVLGDTAGSKVQIDAGQVEFEIPKVEVPDADEATITLTGKCLGSSGEDEITVAFI
jgi:hypothetical protein